MSGGVFTSRENGGWRRNGALGKRNEGRMTMKTMTRGIAAMLLLAVLGGCIPDQRYVNHDAACAAMPCHKRAWEEGIVNE